MNEKQVRRQIDAALDSKDFAGLAKRVAQNLSRDNARKARILARSPNVFFGMDAEELGRASARELALRELKGLGITPGDNSDPIELLDAHHAGRAFARDYVIPGNRLTGGNEIPGNNGNKLIGEARDSAGQSFVDRYLQE